MRFLILTENEILLFLIFGSFEKIFSLKMFSKIQPNAFPLPFSIFSENKNKKQSNQTPLTKLFSTYYVSNEICNIISSPGGQRKLTPCYHSKAWLFWLRKSDPMAQSI